MVFKVRLIVSKPSEHWLSEKPVENGYWGFIRCRKDYEDEKNTIKEEMEKIVESLIDEGKDLELLSMIEIQNINDVMDKFNSLMEADLNIVLVFFPIGVWDPGSLIYAIISASKYVVFFDKFRPNTYAGTLFTPPAIKYLEERKMNNKVFIVEGDVEKLKSIIRAIYGLYKLSHTKLVCVGPINSAFGGWPTLKKGMETYGFDVKFYTYNEFTNDFNKFLKEKGEEAEKIVENFVSNAVRIVEPTSEKLVRAAVYHLVLKKYLEENNSDWITVNCLSRLVGETKATPCMSFSILNDMGYVATCEADATAMILHYLMRHISSKPAFFNDPTVNEKDGTLILAHCTSPTKMLGYGKERLKYEVRTHHESNYGATPKPYFEEGVVTIAGLSFNLDKMLIITGKVVGSPRLRICRSQVEVKVKNASKILEDWQGFHWIMVYGDYSEELKTICHIKGIKTILHLLEH